MIRNSWSGPDYHRDRAASRKLAEQIRQYWLNRGRNYNVWVELDDYHDSKGKNKEAYFIRSNIKLKGTP